MKEGGGVESAGLGRFGPGSPRFRWASVGRTRGLARTTGSDEHLLFTTALDGYDSFAATAPPPHTPSSTLTFGARNLDVVAHVLIDRLLLLARAGSE